MRRGLWMIFRWPLLIGLLSAIGLVSALLDDGLYDALSWFCLGIPLALVARAVLFAPPAQAAPAAHRRRLPHS
ncbi:hypothetical protein LMK08_11020 [Metapseudomonas furukawaii]|uniref:hypothetical protein n=1 Tax=Metapseudomonas furukawaii TaxID=1149133 RepID=UPI00227C7C06|nr:hypothetical protein [Pseudomonas furukawaii]WAG81156.1 hypothetical protein LMK08_11020 [Pseudomonas furukawaii]